MLDYTLKYHGGKGYLAKKIIDSLPPHTHYCEPYFGSGKVLFRKPFEGVSEVVNDIDGDLVNFWKVLQSVAYFDQFVRLVNCIPFSQEEFEISQAESSDRVRRAASFFVRNRQSRQALGKSYATPTKRTRRGMNENVSAYLKAVDGLFETHQRLRRVEITCIPAVDLIRERDHKNCFHYCDPTYVHDVRVSVDSYKFEMTIEQHEELLKTLAAVKGNFILSGYSHPLYEQFAKKHKWKKDVIRIDNKASAKKKKIDDEKKTGDAVREECLWRNFK